VRIVVCVLLILANSFAWCAPPDEPTEERALYRRAAQALEQHDLPAAIELLEQLTLQSPDSPLSEIAAFHLAECYQLTSRPSRAFELLSQWGKRIDASQTLTQLAPDTQSKTRRLFANVLENLVDEPASLELLQQHYERAALGGSNQEADWYGTQLAIELVKRLERQQQYAQAERCLRRVVESGVDVPAELRTKLELDLPLVWGEHALAQGEPRVAIAVLQRALEAKPEAEQELALRFLLAEALFAAGERLEAGEQFQWLAAQGDAAAIAPAWQAAVALRQAELLVRSRQFSEAREMLLQARKRHAEFEAAYEFDYLLARCALSRIEFDEATSLLERVLTSPAAVGKEAQAKAGWLLGEILFLQRQYAPAIAAYSRVARMAAFPEWQARALLQSAKCHELMGNASAALTDYQRASELSQQPEITRTATERTAVLQSSTSNLR